MKPANPGQVILAAQKIHEHLNLRLQLDDHTLRIQVNIGITYYPHNSRMSSELIRQAGIAARAAAKKRINYCVYSKDAIAQTGRISLESSLENAIDNAEIRAYYQPIVDIRSGKTIAFESLARWNCAEFGVIPPETFIDISETSLLIRKLTILTLNTTMREFHNISTLFPGTKISVNLSPVLLDNSDIIDLVKRALTIWNIQPESLMLEITETAIMKDSEISSSILRKLAELGIGIVIDDFGMGQASLKYIKQFPISEIKIDKSFILDIDRDSNDMKIVNSIIELSHNLNLTVVAEGIERAECVKKLREMNCDYGQGYYYTRPMPVEKLAEWSKSS